MRKGNNGKKECSWIVSLLLLVMASTLLLLLLLLFFGATFPPSGPWPPHSRGF